MKKKLEIIIASIVLIYLLLPFKISEDRVIYVDKGYIWSGNIETNKIKIMLSKTFITNIAFICANVVDREKLYQLKEGDSVYFLTYDRHNNLLYAIVENKIDGTYSIKEFYDHQDRIIKNLKGLNKRYFGIYYCNDKLYYWVDDRNTEKKFLEIFNLNNGRVERRIQVAGIGENIIALGNRIVFSTTKEKKSDIYSFIENDTIGLFIKGMDTPMKFSNTEILCLDTTNYNDIYLYDLKSAQRAVWGKNDGRAWYRNAFILSNKQYYITEKNIHTYDIREWYTINDFDGGMQILSIDGPIISSLQ